MAVLIEGISVVIRWDAVDRGFEGSRSAFVTSVPNKTYCGDGDLARVGFMAPAHVQAYVRLLESRGLTFMRDGRAVDLVVVDQVRGLTCPADWLEFARVVYGEGGGKVGICWLGERSGGAEGLLLPPMPLTIATPPGWRYEGSLSAQHTFVPVGEATARLEPMGRDGGMDVYRDRKTGRLLYLAPGPTAGAAGGEHGTGPSGGGSAGAPHAGVTDEPDGATGAASDEWEDDDRPS